MVADARRLREWAAIQDGVHRTVKCRPIRVAKVIHKHSGFSIGQYDRIPGRSVCRFFLEADVCQLRQTTSVVDDDLFAPLNCGSRFVFVDQFRAPPPESMTAKPSLNQLGR